jgi:hypothetical protein
MGVKCCPNRNFIGNSDLNNGLLYSIVENRNGSALKTFCEYANLNAYNKLREIYPTTANDNYNFYEREIQRFFDFISGNKNLNANNIIIYKIYISGLNEIESSSLMNSKKKTETISIQFNLNAEFRRTNEAGNEIFKYVYHWRKKDLFGSGEPIQKIKFYGSESKITDTDSQNT